MEKAEAIAIAEARLGDLRTQPYGRLVADLLKQPRTEQVTAPSGQVYQLQIEAYWDDRAKQHLRVVAAVDDGGLRAFFPLSRDFIIAPDGTFVGE